MSNPSTALASYALLNVSWSYEGRTYLDNFVPFVAEACYLTGEVGGISVGVAIDAVRDSFGIELPAQVMQTVFHRVAKAKRGHLKNKQLHLDIPAQKQLPRLLAQRAAFERANAELVEKMIAFCLHSFAIDLDSVGAEQLLFKAIADQSFMIVKSAVSGTPHNPDPGESPEEKATAAFITQVLARDPAGTSQIENLAMGSTLAASVYLDSADAQSRKFRDTAIFLDTPIALKALGYEGATARELALQTLELARASGAQISIFEHSVKEVRSVLRGSADVLRQHGRRDRPIRPVDAYFRDNGFTTVEVQMFEENVEDDLVSLKVSVVAKPDDYATFGIDEKAFESTLQRYVGYRQRPTLLNDLDSVAAVIRLRKGKHPQTLEGSIATLLSDNSNLQAAARTLNGKFKQWDTVTLDDALSTLLWLKEPTLAPTLPLVRVAADCLSALTPSRAFWEDFVVEVDRQTAVGTITAADALALRNTIEAQHAIVVDTGGDPSKLNATSVVRVRDQVVGALTAPVVEKLDETASELELERRRASELERENSDFRLRETKVRSRARSTAEKWMLAFKIATGAVLFVSAGVTSGVQLTPTIVALPTPWSLLLGGAVIIGSALAAVLAVFGVGAIPSVKGWIENRTASIERKLLRPHGLDGTQP